MNHPQFFFVNGPRMYTHFKTLKLIPIGTEIFFVEVFEFCFLTTFFQKIITFDRKIPDTKFLVPN